MPLAPGLTELGVSRFGGLSPLRPGVFQFHDLTMGDPNGDVLIDEVDGLDMPDVKVESSDLIQEHGGLIFAEFLKPRILTFTGSAGANLTPAARQAVRVRMGSAFAPKRSDAELSFAVEDGTYRVIRCRPTRFSYRMNRKAVIALVEWAAELQAQDPRIYADTPTFVDIDPQGPATGITYPITYPITYGGGPSGVGLVTNLGNLDTPPVVRIYGPASDPLVINRTADDTMAMTIDIPAGEFLELDYAAKTITLNGTTSRYSALDEGEWAGILPGDNAIQVIASGIDGRTRARVTFRSAWANV